VLADCACNGWAGRGQASVEFGDGLGDETVAFVGSCVVLEVKFRETSGEGVEGGGVDKVSCDSVITGLKILAEKLIGRKKGLEILQDVYSS
jgi:hypothetical protein